MAKPLKVHTPGDKPRKSLAEMARDAQRSEGGTSTCPKCNCAGPHRGNVCRNCKTPLRQRRARNG